MDFEEKRELLRSYRKRCAITREFENQVEDLKESAALRSLRYDGMPRSRRTSDLSDWAEKQEAMEEKLRLAVSREYDALHKVEAAIEKLADPLMRYVMRAHYIEMKNIPTIARECGCCVSKVWKTHGNALKAITFDEVKDGLP